MRPICVWADILLKTLQQSSIQQSVHEKTYPLHASPTLSIYLKSTSDRIWLHNFQLHLSAPFTCISHISILCQLQDTTLHLLQHLASVSTKLLFPTKCTQLPTALNDVLQDNSHISVRTTKPKLHNFTFLILRRSSTCILVIRKEHVTNCICTF